MPLVVSIVSPDLERVSKLLKGVGANKAPERAIVDAVNRSLSSGKKTISVSVRQRYNLAAANIKEDIQEKKAYCGNEIDG